jgi:hypothetical protein
MCRFPSGKWSVCLRVCLFPFGKRSVCLRMCTFRSESDRSACGCACFRSESDRSAYGCATFRSECVWSVQYEVISFSVRTQWLGLRRDCALSPAADHKPAVRRALGAFGQHAQGGPPFLGRRNGRNQPNLGKKRLSLAQGVSNASSLRPARMLGADFLAGSRKKMRKITSTATEPRAGVIQMFCQSC